MDSPHYINQLRKDNMKEYTESPIEIRQKANATIFYLVGFVVFSVVGLIWFCITQWKG